MAQSVLADPIARLLRALLPRRWRRPMARLFMTIWLQATVILLVAYGVILLTGIVTAAQRWRADGADARMQREEQLQDDVRRLRLGVAMESGGLSGYVLTAAPSYLADYQGGRDQVAASWPSLVADAGSSGLEGEVPPLRERLQAWQAWAAARRGETDAGGVRAADPGPADEGRVLLDRVSAAGDRLEGVARDRAARDRAQFKSAQAAAAAGYLLGPIAGNGAMVILASILIAVALHPMSRLADVATRLAAGVELVVPYFTRASEVGSLARALVRWQNAERSRRAIVEHTPVGMLTLDLDLRIRDPNPALVEMLGHSAEDLSRLTIEAVTHPDGRAATREACGRLQSGKAEHVRIEERYLRRDGSTFWGCLTAAAVLGSGGRPANFVGILEDINERREKLARAARVQRDLLPDRAPALDGYELAGLCRQTEEVGSDFFDWYQPDPATLTLTLGDVMGKGLSGALLMATMRIALRSSSRLPSVEDAVELAAASTLRDLEKAGAFMTLFHARLDLASGRLTYVGAGHGLGVLLRADGAHRLPRGGALPLGVLGGQRYPQLSETLRPGDALAVFSDGVLDVHPELRRDMARSVAAIVAGAATAREMAERLAAGPDIAIADDVTVVVLRRERPPVR
jgi:PAS domain S-box-containing protein